ncbi:MAG: hypothetical protein L0Y71_15755 [Gemmataceae bacterium]|nr:hypothetical protein [Gemmataceae bacterium]
MQLWIVEFHELYARHLCRHSQLGINVIHLAALFAVWYAVYGLLFWLTGIEWTLAVPALAYLAVLAPNLPLRVLAATAVYLGLILAAVLLLPQPPFWVYLIMIPVFYKVQSWSHKFYTVETDMTEFNAKYTKGSVLFVVLLWYEVPIVLNHLLFAPTPALTATQAAPAQVGPARAARDHETAAKAS